MLKYDTMLRELDIRKLMIHGLTDHSRKNNYQLIEKS